MGPRLQALSSFNIIHIPGVRVRVQKEHLTWLEKDKKTKSDARIFAIKALNESGRVLARCVCCCNQPPHTHTGSKPLTKNRSASLFCSIKSVGIDININESN